MRTAIVTTAFGAPIYREMADELCASLKKVGYTDPVFVLDKKEKGRLMKAAFCRYARPKDFDKVLFVDSDFIFKRHPEEIFKLNFPHAAVSVEPNFPLEQNEYNTRFFTEEERRGVGPNDKSFNSGLILYNAEGMKDFMETWERGWWERSDGDLWDQEALQALEHKGKIKCSLLPESVCFFPLTRSENREFSEENIAIHFCGLKREDLQKRFVLNFMRECGAAGTEEIREICRTVRKKISPWNKGTYVPFS